MEGFSITERVNINVGGKGIITFAVEMAPDNTYTGGLKNLYPTIEKVTSPQGNIPVHLLFSTNEVEKAREAARIEAHRRTLFVSEEK